MCPGITFLTLISRPNMTSLHRLSDRQRSRSGFLRRLLASLVVPFFLTVAHDALAIQNGCPEFFVNGAVPQVRVPALQSHLYAVCHLSYASAASGITKTGIWSAEHLTRASVSAARGLPRVNDFHADPSLPAAERAELSDYAGSGRLALDRGHLAPSGDAPSVQAQDETFLLSNMSPQDHQDNAHLWEAIEHATRELALQDGEAYAVTGPVFADRGARRIGSGVYVPTHLWKAVYTPARGAQVYVALNAPGNGYAALSIAEFIRFGGVDPFPSLPESVKSHVAHLPRPRMDGNYLDPCPVASLSAADVGAQEETIQGGRRHSALAGTTQRFVREAND
jgi:endonuclease G